MTYQTNHVPKVALRASKAVPEVFKKPTIRFNPRQGHWLDGVKIEVKNWPKL